MSSHLFEDPPDIRNWHSSYVYESPILDSLCKNTNKDEDTPPVTRSVHSDVQLAGSKMVGKGVKRGRMYSPDYGQVETTVVTHPNSTMVVHTSPDPQGGTLHSKVRKVRGPTSLSEMLDLPKGTKLPISWNSKGEPAGKYRSKFASFCGIIARDPSNAPLQVEKFYSIPKDMKTDMFKLVCAHFDIDSGSATVKSLVLSSIGKKYSDHLNKLKKNYFLEFETIEHRLKNLPPDMDKQDWEYLVKKWSSEKHKVLSQRNSKSRDLAQSRHTSGTVSHGNVFDDEMKKNGEPPTSYDFFRKVYTHRADGTPADQKTAHIISLVEDEAAKVDAGRTTPVCKDTIFKVVRGPVKKTVGRVTTSLDNARIDELKQQLEETEAARQTEKAAREAIQNKYDSLVAIHNISSNVIASEASSPYVDSDETQG